MNKIFIVFFKSSWLRIYLTFLDLPFVTIEAHILCFVWQKWQVGLLNPASDNFKFKTPVLTDGLSGLDWR